MDGQADMVVHKTAKPIVAGIFNIVIGSICMLCVLGLAIAAAVLAPISSDLPAPIWWLLSIIAVPIAALGIVSIVGGVYAIQRRMWGWALAGSITTAFISNVLGIVAIVLTAVSRDEFGR
jgi:hypothetical protein